MLYKFLNLFTKRKKKVKAKLEMYNQNDLIQDAYTNASIVDADGKRWQGPYSSNQKVYADYYKYFCTFIQKALLEGKRVKIPGVGTIWLEEKEGYTIKKSFFTGKEVYIPKHSLLKAKVSVAIKRVKNHD